MKRIYAIYGLTLLPALLVYWMFAVMAAVAAGSTWVPFSAFVASILHFCISSWLFVCFPGAGKVTAIMTGTAMSIWPVAAVVNSLATGWGWGAALYALPLLMNGMVVYYHVATFGQTQQPPLPVRVLMSIPPLGVLVAFLAYYV